MRLIDADEFIKKFKNADADTEEQKIMCTLERFGCSSILADMIEVVRVGGIDA